MAIFDVMANLVVAPEETPSMLDDVDDDMPDLVRVEIHEIGIGRRASEWKPPKEVIQLRNLSRKIRWEGNGCGILPSTKSRKQSRNNHCNACRSFPVNERRYWHCGQSREEDGGERENSGRPNEGRILGAQRKKDYENPED